MDPERTIIAALVVYFNSGPDFDRCIQSLKGEVDRIYVLENASTEPGVRGRLKATYGARDDISLSVSDENLGFGGGINYLANKALNDRADYLWFVNPDCVIESGGAKRMVDVMVSDRLSVASPVVFTGDRATPTLWFAGGRLDMKRGYSEHIVSPPRDMSAVECTFISGAAMMVDAVGWVQLNGFRSDLFMYWEDAELCARATALGLRMAVVPSASAWHREGGSSGTGEGRSRLYYYYMSRNRLAIHGGLLTRLDILLGRGARMTLRLLASGARETADPLGKLWSCIRGGLSGVFH